MQDGKSEPPPAGQVSLVSAGCLDTGQGPERGGQASAGHRARGRWRDQLSDLEDEEGCLWGFGLFPLRFFPCAVGVGAGKPVALQGG